VHAANIAAHPQANLAYVCDVVPDAAQALSERHGAESAVSAREVIEDASIDAVLIASSTDTHLDLLAVATAAGKPVLCEKPIDLDLKRVDSELGAIDRTQVPVLIGFQRRYDANFAALREDIRSGGIGDLEIVKITSRDPSPPPLAYLRVSGGIFRDMMIHDFDLARWLLGEEPVEVSAVASCLVDSEIGDAGDVDTAVVSMRTGSGKLCQIDNSRRAVYGYDQRVEVLGSAGMSRAENVRSTTVERWTSESVWREKPPPFFLERYADAYRAELDHFVTIVQGDATPYVTTHDGRQALALAETALASSKSARIETPPTAP